MNGADGHHRRVTRAHLAALRRTAIGPWDAADALALEGASPATLQPALRPLREAVAHLPAVEVGAADATRVRHGGRIEAGEACEGPVAVTSSGELLAVAEFRDGLYAPLVVLVL